MPAMIMAMAVFLLSPAARAATVIGFSDLVTRLQVSVAADHEIKFVTPSGVDASGDTITAAFQSDYNLSSVSFDDVDLAVDTDATPGDCAGTFTDKILASAPGLSPVWGVGVSGQVLTFTPPTDAASGEIAAGSCIRIRIGSNAVSGSVGNDQIINPSSPVFHTVTLGGGFGDTGNGYTLNNDSDQVTVTATIGGGGGGGGGGGVPVAPTIMNVRVLNVTETTADVFWDTDVSASSVVDYGPTGAYGSTVSAAGTTFNHDVQLTGLAPGTLYHFRVRSAGVGTPEAVSSDATFTTADTTAPLISNVQALDITGTSARITWDTDEDADSRVDYGVSEPFSLNGTNSVLTNIHSITVTGLTPDTIYQYRVTSKDAAANAATSVLFTFQTLDTTAPVISNIFVDAITQTSARINWTTNELATSQVAYGQNPTYGGTAGNGGLVANHQTTLPSLISGRLYHFSVSSYDGAGNGATSTDQTFTTLPDTTPPANVSNFNATPGDHQNALQWNNPPDADFAGVKIQRATGGYPANPGAGTTIYNGNGTSKTDTGLTNGVTYYYAAFAYDSSGNYASGALARATPQGPVPTTLCGNNLCEAGENSTNCPIDCPPPVLPPPAHLDPTSIKFFAIDRLLSLDPDPGGAYRILPGRSFSTDIPIASLPQPTASITLDFAGGTYLFAPSGGEQWADVSAPSTPGIFTGSITLKYQDGTGETVPFNVQVEHLGLVYVVREGQRVPVQGATVTIEKEINPWVTWDAAAYHETNPTVTGADGLYGLMVPPGRYRIAATKAGYRPASVPPFDVTTEVINPDIELIEIPPPITEVIVPNAPVTENTANVARTLVAQGAYILKILQNEVIENPRVKTVATQIIAPAAAVVTIAVAMTAIQSTNLVSYLYFLLTQPLLLLGRRRRKEFGTVYNALTKRPIDLAIVRLVRAATGKLVRTLVTDKQGRYSFLVDPGEYRIAASKPGFTFPSRYLQDKREDAEYLDLYHGEVVHVGETGAILTANIPLDPVDSVKSARRLIWEEIGRRVQTVLASLSSIVTIVAALLYRLPYLYLLAGIQIALFFLFRRLARPPRPKNWGIIYDARTKKPIPFAVTRIVETQYHKVLESRVTDSAGRYNFLVGNNKYVVTVEKPGYDPFKTEELDLSGTGKEGGVVSKDIPLQESKKP